MKPLLLLLLSLTALNLFAQETVKDIDGNLYKTVTISQQVWMAENLRVTQYNDGTAIPLVMDEGKWSNLSTGAYCTTQTDPEKYKETYGLMYNFFAVIDNRGLCPAGWHAPTAEEWNALIDFLGGKTIAGAKMKDIGSGLWSVVAAGSDSSSGFAALPAGGRGRFGSIEEVGNYATWWSSTSEDNDFAWHWGLYPQKNDIRFNPGHKNSGFSVRCVKDN